MVPWWLVYLHKFTHIYIYIYIIHTYIYIPAWDWPKTKTKVALFEEHLPTGVVFVGVFLSTEVVFSGEISRSTDFPFKRTRGRFSKFEGNSKPRPTLNPP